MRRREFLTLPAALSAAPAGKPKVAAIVTEYRYYSHADVICGRIFDGYFPNNVRVEPRTQIVSMYTDQIAEKDMSRGLAEKHGYRIYPSIGEALCLGSSKLAVDAVLLIGEHGNYPRNDKGQKLYPRYELYEKILDVYRKSGRAVPTFVDKHLSYSWTKAKAMYDQAGRLKFPLMAGSSIPLTVKQPPADIPYGAKIDQAVVAAYGHDDDYGFHALETLQCMVERRAGGETGIAAVHMITGDDVWRWQKEAGAWSVPLLESALATNPKRKPGRPEEHAKRPSVFVLEYRDGLQASVYMLDGYQSGFLFAANLKDNNEPVATHFGFTGEGRQLPHFDGLVRCIEEMFVTRRPVYPVERTLLTTGVLAFLFDSIGKGRIETPELRVRYKAPQTNYVQTA